MSRSVEDIQFELDVANAELERCYEALCLAMDEHEEAECDVEMLEEELDQANKEATNET